MQDFYQPISLTLKTPLEESQVRWWLLHVFERPKCLNLKKNKSTPDKTKALFPSKNANGDVIATVLLNYQVRSVQAPETFKTSYPSSQTPVPTDQENLETRWTERLSSMSTGIKY